MTGEFISALEEELPDIFKKIPGSYFEEFLEVIELKWEFMDSRRQGYIKDNMIKTTVELIALGEMLRQGELEKEIYEEFITALTKGVYTLKEAPNKPNISVTQQLSEQLNVILVDLLKELKKTALDRFMASSILGEVIFALKSLLGCHDDFGVTRRCQIEFGHWKNVKNNYSCFFTPAVGAPGVTIAKSIKLLAQAKRTGHPLFSTLPVELLVSIAAFTEDLPHADARKLAAKLCPSTEPRRALTYRK